MPSVMPISTAEGETRLTIAGRVQAGAVGRR
jgi:hypothetical protein